MGAIFDGIYTIWNQLIYAITSIGIPFVIIDIAVMSFIIYKAICYLRETRAGQLLKGIVIILLLYFVANWWELATLKWVLTRVVDSAIIAAAVIFQPELRRILERVGRTKFGHNIFDEKNSSLSDCIDRVCKAAGIMQEKKIGALIVFERSTQLGEIINTGTVIDATPSVSVINNIFFPKSPLHDGAMIIREGRVFAAGCILPLTQQDNINYQLGTRHRAAIGMTENSDAVVLVVSEETGVISIVSNGAIKRNFNAVSAGAELRSLLLTENDEKNNAVTTVLKQINPFKKSLGKESDENEKNN